MKLHYTSDSLDVAVTTKEIKAAIAPTGTTNMIFVAIAQHDPCFETYAAIDKRSDVL